MNHKHKIFVASLLATALLAGCNGDEDEKKSAGGSAGLTVTPSLGAIFNAAVEARCAATGLTLGSGTTGSTGLISLTLSGSCSSPVIVEVFASASSTYFDEQANAEVAMPAGTQLRALLPSLSAASGNIAVTPLTEIAFRQALAAAASSESAITTAQVTAANSAVAAQVFGAAAATLDILQAPTLWTAATTTLGSSNADRYAYYLAALAGMGSTSATPALAVTDALASDLADGVLSGFSGADVSYTPGDFSGKFETALAGFSAYASPELKTELGIDNDDPELPDNLSVLTNFAGTYTVSGKATSDTATRGTANRDHVRGSITITADGAIDFDSGISLAVADIVAIYDRRSVAHDKRVAVNYGQSDSDERIRIYLDASDNVVEIIYDDGAGNTTRAAIGVTEEPGGGEFPNEIITLASKSKNASSADIASTGIVGTFTGSKGKMTINGSTTAVDNCSVTVAANGDITVSAGAESLTQTLDGGLDDSINVQGLIPNSWILDAGPGTGSAFARLNIYRNKMAMAYAQTTTADKVIQCWMPVNRVKTSAAADWNTDYKYGSATASNFSSAIVGSYSGKLHTDSGVLQPEGSTCKVLVGADGKMELTTGGAATAPITRTAWIAGDALDIVQFNSNDNWRLQAHDLNDPASNRVVQIELFRVTATSMTATALDSVYIAWGCRDMSKDGTEEPGDNEFPNEIITLPSTTKTLLQAADIAGAVGTFTGTKGLIKEGGNSTTVDSCSVTVAASGDITVNVGAESITQTVDGGNGDASVVALTNTDTWTFSAGGAPGTNVPWASLNIDRNKMIDAYAYIVADTSAIPTVFTKELKCWMPINRLQTVADNDWNSRSASATASDFHSAIAGTYTGNLSSDNGTLAPVGATCTLVVGTDGSMNLSTGGTVSEPVSLAAQIAGDNDDQAVFTNDLDWSLRARDVSDPVGNAHVTVNLQYINSMFTVTGARKPANQNTAAGWACNGMTKAE